MAKEKFYITTSIPYLNAKPHLGFALEALQADILARYSRLLGKDVFFLSGTDEHGAKVMKAAEVAGKSPKEFTDEFSGFFQDLLKKLNISNDDFIRTSDKKRHWPGAQLLWKKLADSGDIYKGFYKGLYCVGHEAFITEKDMEGGICILHKKPPEKVEEDNYFFKLSKYTNRLRSAISNEEIKIIPDYRKNETLNMLAEIGDISFSRPSKDIPWGVPVPGDATQTMYVWSDALANYITALGFGDSNFQLPTSNFHKFWSADAHIVGKDIMKFHTIFWPAMLMSAGLSLPKTIFVHGFINVKGEKMSKSLGNVIDPFPLIEKYGSEAVRFYLAREVSAFGDSDYSDKHFAEVYEGILVNGLGNLVSRVVKMLSFFPEIPRPDGAALARFPLKKKDLEALSAEKKFTLEGAHPVYVVENILWPKYRELMDSYNFWEAAESTVSYAKKLDEYIEEYKVYKIIKTNPEDAKIMLWHLAYSLASLAWMLKPFMPGTAEKILEALGIDSNSREGWIKFSAKEISHLFPRIK